MDLLRFLCVLAIFFVVLANAEENNEYGPPAFHKDAPKIKSDEDSDGDDDNDEVGVPPWLVPLHDEVDAKINSDGDSDGDDDEVESSLRDDKVDVVVASDVKDALFGRRRHYPHRQMFGRRRRCRCYRRRRHSRRHRRSSRRRRRSSRRRRRSSRRRRRSSRRRRRSSRRRRRSSRRRRGLIVS